MPREKQNLAKYAELAKAVVSMALQVWELVWLAVDCLSNDQLDVLTAETKKLAQLAKMNGGKTVQLETTYLSSQHFVSNDDTSLPQSVHSC